MNAAAREPGTRRRVAERRPRPSLRVTPRGRGPGRAGAARPRRRGPHRGLRRVRHTHHGRHRHRCARGPHDLRLPRPHRHPRHHHLRRARPRAGPVGRAAGRRRVRHAGAGDVRRAARSTYPGGRRSTWPRRRSRGRRHRRRRGRAVRLPHRQPERPRPRRHPVPCSPGAVVVHRRRRRARPLLDPGPRQRRPRPGGARPEGPRPRRAGRHRRHRGHHPRAAQRQAGRPVRDRAADRRDGAQREHQPRPGRRLGRRPLRREGVRDPGPGVAERHRPAQPNAPARRCCRQTRRPRPCWSPTRPTSRPWSTYSWPASPARSRPPASTPISVAPGAVETIDLSKVLPKKEPLALRLRVPGPRRRLRAHASPATTTPTPPRSRRWSAPPPRPW